MVDRAGLDHGDFLDAEVLGDRDRNELGLALAPLDAGGDLLAVQTQQVHDEVDGARQVAGLATVEMQRVRRLVLDEDRAVAIEDVAARGRDLDRADAIVLGEREVIVAPRDLDEPVGDRQERQHGADGHARHLDPPREPLAILADSHWRDLGADVTAASAAASASTTRATGSPTPSRERLRRSRWPRRARSRRS